MHRNLLRQRSRSFLIEIGPNELNYSALNAFEALYQLS